MLLDDARNILIRLITELSISCERLEIAGGVRRGKPDVHDLELVAIPKVIEVADLFGNPAREYSLLDAELARLDLRQVKGGAKYKQFALPEGISLDLFITTPDQWGWIFMLRTGSADFNRWLVTPRRYGGALPGHIKCRDGWLWNGPNRIKTPDELDVFRLLDVAWLEPRDRDAIGKAQGLWRRGTV